MVSVRIWSVLNENRLSLRAKLYTREGWSDWRCRRSESAALPDYPGGLTCLLAQPAKSFRPGATRHKAKRFSPSIAKQTWRGRDRPGTCFQLGEATCERGELGAGMGVIGGHGSAPRVPGGVARGGVFRRRDTLTPGAFGFGHMLASHCTSVALCRGKMD